jgi:hypothetical protein
MKNTLAGFCCKITDGISLGTLLFALLLPSARAVDVLTHLNNNNRSGANTNETILTPANVNQSQFGQLWSYPVNGSTYAEPLYVSGVSIGGGTHNVVYIVTMEDDVYAFDADSNTLYWHVSFVSGNITACPILLVDGTDTANIIGDVGIESTPYIDKASGTMYLLARTMNITTTNFIQTLHALSITNGAEKFGGPTVISASGFNPKIQNQRMGMAKAGNNIIIAWASHEDYFAYHGWVMAYNATNMTQAAVFNDTPSGTLGGIWQQGRAPCVDSSGNIYFITGNGTWDGTSNFGETMLKMNSNLSILDWFTPDNYATLTAYDEDFGSAGAMLIPGTSLVVGGGKFGTLYVCNTGSMGHEQSGNGQIVQSIANYSLEMHAGPVYWNSAANGGLIFNCGNGDNLKSYKFNGSTFGTSAFQTSTAAAGGDPGGFLSVSANGSSNGIVWESVETTDSDQGTRPGIVRAYNADDIGGTELWDSYQNPTRDNSGTFVKDANPMIANGKVYVGSYDGMVHVYGLLNLTSITLANFSFETNTSGAVFTNKVTAGFDVSGSDVAGWLDAGSTYVNSGVDYAGDGGNIAENGSVLAYCKAGDSGAYHISGYQMQTGNQVTLTWWAKASAGAAGQTVSIMSAASPTSSFSSLTTLATSTATLNQTGVGGAYTQYTLNYVPTQKDAGMYVAVFFATAATPTGTWATFDNFALSVQVLNYTSFSLANYSFETNTTGTIFTNKVTNGFGSVAGWQNAGSTYNNSGVDYAGDNGNVAEDGTVLAYAEAGDSGAYQISGYQMQTGNPVTITWWAKASAGAAGQSVSLLSAATPTSSFSSLTTLATSTSTLNQEGDTGAFYLYSLTYTPTLADAGKYVAISFKTAATPASTWASFDNFGLWIQSNAVPVANGIYNIVNLNSGLLVDVKNSATTNGTPVDQYASNGGGNQQWGVTNVGGGIYKIIGVQSGLALDVVGSGTANGTLIDVWPYNSTYANQQWAITPASGGYYRLTPQNATGSGLDVQHSGTTNGTPLEIWTYGGGNSQQWKLQTP